MTHTVSTLLETVCAQFEQHELSYGHGTDNAWDEAVALVLGVTGLADDQSTLSLHVSAEDERTILDYAAQRITRRVPLAHILGHTQYMGLQFAMQPGVVVPRSPIGYLLQDGLQPWLPGSVRRILDLCCGSGCLGIVAAYIYPDAHVTLVELDPTAAALARQNVALHGLDKRVEVIEADVTATLDFAGRFDLILTNPPYVDAVDMSALPAEFQAEPEHGLAAGEDGLAVINGIFAHLPGWLAFDGLFVGEVGASAPHLLHAYPDYPFIWPDLDRGGEGVFLLEAKSLNSHTARDSQ